MEEEERGDEAPGWAKTETGSQESTRHNHLGFTVTPDQHRPVWLFDLVFRGAEGEPCRIGASNAAVLLLR